jgi:signal transduction histidine kinase
LTTTVEPKAERPAPARAAGHAAPAADTPIFWALRRQSLSRRLLLVAFAWITALLTVGGVALDRVITRALTDTFDLQLSRTLTSMIGAGEIGPEGEVRFTRALGDQRFFEPYSGLYWQVSAAGAEPFRSRSLWDRALPIDIQAEVPDERRSLRVAWNEERLRLAERDVILPGSTVRYRFVVAARVDELEAQVAEFRRTLVLALALVGLGMLLLALLQVTVGLLPLRKVRAGLEAVRTGTERRLDPDFPPEIQPLVTEMNALLDHGEAQSEQARTHAGNLAHALKTPMAVLLNEARQQGGHLAETVVHQTEVMQRHVEHHLARARALGHRAGLAARTPVQAPLEGLKRVLERIYGYKKTQITLDLAPRAAFRGERQDLEEMLGNLLDNACKYGLRRVRVSAQLQPIPGEPQPNLILLVEDDGPGIPESLRERLFARGTRLDESLPGTGLGLAIVRDIADIYGGSVALDRSGDLGGLKVVLTLPGAAVA